MAVPVKKSRGYIAKMCNNAKRDKIHCPINYLVFAAEYVNI